jgi:hypothetical protein
MYDILPFLAALGPDCAISANNISGILRRRGWIESSVRIAWAAEVIRTRSVPTPPAGLPTDQVTDARNFVQRYYVPGGPPSPFDIDMSSPFRSGWTGGLGGPGSGGHRSPHWYIQFGMDLGVATGTEVRAAFAGHVTRFNPHIPSHDSNKVYGAQLFMRSANGKMGGFYTHFTLGPGFSNGQRIDKGDLLGRIMRNHLHLALVEIIRERHVGVDLYTNFLAMRDSLAGMTVNFKQNGSPPTVV